MQIVNLLDRQGVQVTPKTHIKSVYNTDNESLGDLLSFTGSTVTINNTVVADEFVGDLTGNADTASKWETTRTLTLTGDTTGSVTVDGSSDMTLEVEVLDDSHNHTISNVDGLQDTLDDINSDFSVSLTDLETSLTEKINTVESELSSDLSDHISDTNNPHSVTYDQVGAPSTTGTNASGTWGIDISGNSATATQLATARTIAISGGAIGTATSFDGSANISIPVTTLYEDYLRWGSTTDDMSSYPTASFLVDRIGADRFALFKPANITLEHSQDNGSTWTEVTTESTKASLFTRPGGSITLGGNTTSGNEDIVNYRTRITMHASAELYGYLRTIAIRFSTEGSTGCHVTIEAHSSTYEVWETLIDQKTFSGWPGWTVFDLSSTLTVGESSSSWPKYEYLRFTFGCTGFDGSSYTGLKLGELHGYFIGCCYNAGNNLSRYGHLYTADYNYNATFPAQVIASGGFSGDLAGNADTATSLETARTISLTGDVTGSTSTDFSGNVSIATTHVSSGVTAGSYGQSSTSTLSNGGSFSVPYVTVNSTGHITSVSTSTVTLPTFTGTSPITVSGTAISHNTSGATAGTYGPTSSATLTSSGTFTVPNVTVDSYGHVTSAGSVTLTLPASGTYTGSSPITVSGSTISHDTSGVTAGSYGPTANTSPGSAGTFTVPQITVNTYGHVTSVTARTITMPTVTSYSAGTGISISSNTINHSNSITSGTVGPSADSTLTSGGTFTVPYVAYDAQGHITSVSNRTMTMPTISSGVTVSNSTSTFYLTGTTSTGTISTFYRAASVYISSGTSVYASSGFYVTSSREFKENIVPAKENALELVDSLEIVDFTYKDDEKKHQRIGFIAEDTPAIFLDEEGSHSDVYNCIGVLLKAVQELSAEVKQLKARLSE